MLVTPDNVTVLAQSDLMSKLTPRSSVSSSTGKQFWVFKDTVLQPGYPQDISTFGNGMPAQSIETAVWWEDVAKTYFFKGDRWVNRSGLNRD